MPSRTRRTLIPTVSFSIYFWYVLKIYIMVCEFNQSQIDKWPHWTCLTRCLLTVPVVFLPSSYKSIFLNFIGSFFYYLWFWKRFNFWLRWFWKYVVFYKLNKRINNNYNRKHLRQSFERNKRLILHVFLEFLDCIITTIQTLKRSAGMIVLMKFLNRNLLTNFYSNLLCLIHFLLIFSSWIRDIFAMGFSDFGKNYY